MIIALWISLLFGASLLWPMSQGYDEPDHVQMAMMYAERPFHFYGPSQLPTSKAVQGMDRAIPPQLGTIRLANLPVPPRGKRPTLNQLGGTQLIHGSLPNQLVEHPPLYYWLEALILNIPGMSGLGWDTQVWIMRVLSIILVAPVPFLAWATTLRLRAARKDKALGLGSMDRVALVAAVVPLTIPNLIRDGSSVNNDALVIGATSVILYLLSRVVTGDLSRKTAGVLALFLAVALWTKGLALVLVPIVPIAYLIGSRSVKADQLPWYRGYWRALGIVAIGAAAGLSWWLRNLIDYGAVQPPGLNFADQIRVYGTPDHQGTLLRFLPTFITEFVERLWGGIGMLDVPTPGPFLVYGWFFFVLVGIGASLFARAERWVRARAILFAGLTVLTFLVIAENSFSANRIWSHVFAGIQGRYVYQTVVGIAALTAIGWEHLLRPRAWHLTLPFVLVGAIITNATAWVLILRSWYQPATGLPAVRGLLAALHTLLRISPVPSVVTILLVGVGPLLISLLAAAWVLIGNSYGPIADVESDDHEPTTTTRDSVALGRG